MHFIRRSNERGYVHQDWLESYHSFSFGSYFDPKWMGFGPLRVINEDKVQPGTGFGTHGHNNMEIITWMLDGELSHQDSLGGGSTIVPGQLQCMSAGTGIRHSEKNLHASKVAHLLQIWIEPAIKDVLPGYRDYTIAPERITGCLGLVVTGDPELAPRHNIALIHQDASLYVGQLHNQRVEHVLATQRACYLHVAKGAVLANGESLNQGDALLLTDQPGLIVQAQHSAQVLVFDLPAGGGAKGA
ncbi:MAG: pirin family protein [Limnobacter sp.]|nr:pirin family protein [Limnobacter sp.]